MRTLEQHGFPWGNKIELLRKKEQLINSITIISSNYLKLKSENAGLRVELNRADGFINHLHKELSELHEKMLMPIVEEVCLDMLATATSYETHELKDQEFHFSVRTPRVMLRDMSHLQSTKFRNDVINHASCMLADAITKHILSGITRSKVKER